MREICNFEVLYLPRCWRTVGLDLADGLQSLSMVAVDMAEKIYERRVSWPRPKMIDFARNCQACRGEGDNLKPTRDIWKLCDFVSGWNERSHAASPSTYPSNVDMVLGYSQAAVSLKNGLKWHERKKHSLCSK